MLCRFNQIMNFYDRTKHFDSVHIVQFNYIHLSGWQFFIMTWEICCSNIMIHRFPVLSNWISWESLSKCKLRESFERVASPANTTHVTYEIVDKLLYNPSISILKNPFIYFDSTHVCLVDLKWMFIHGSNTEENTHHINWTTACATVSSANLRKWQSHLTFVVLGKKASTLFWVAVVYHNKDDRWIRWIHNKYYWNSIVL